MKVVLFGQSGQIGEALLEKERCHYEWYAPLRSTPEGDLLNPKAISQYLFALKPDAVVNAAAFTDVDAASDHTEEAMVINGITPGVMAEVCSQIGAYFIHLSTDYVFDGSGDKPWRETAPVCPINAYGQTKLQAEKRILSKADTSVILRLSWLHAAHHDNFVTRFCKRLQEQSEVFVVDDQFGSPTAAVDVAEIIAKLLVCRSRGQELLGLYHFANAGYCSRFECAQQILEQLTLAQVPWAIDKKLFRAKTTDFPSLAPRPLNCRLDTEKLRQTLKIAPRPWQEALGATLSQYVSN